MKGAQVSNHGLFCHSLNHLSFRLWSALQDTRNGHIYINPSHLRLDISARSAQRIFHISDWIQAPGQRNVSVLLPDRSTSHPDQVRVPHFYMIMKSIDLYIRSVLPNILIDLLPAYYLLFLSLTCNMNNTPPLSNDAVEEFACQLRRISEVTGVRIHQSLQVMLLIITSLLRAIDCCPAVDGAVVSSASPPPTVLALPCATLHASTATDTNPIVQAVTTVPAAAAAATTTRTAATTATITTTPTAAAMATTTPPVAAIPSAIGPIRTNRSPRFYCVVVGREIGVFDGPW